jgi:hypothetical protein
MAAALQSHERALATRLRTASVRHAAEAEVHHLALDLADWSDEHADAIGPWAGAGAGPEPAPDESSPPDPALALLWDLRAVHRQALDAALCWEVVAASAKAVHDEALEAIALRCHGESVRQAAWAAGLAKQGSPQVLGS